MDKYTSIILAIKDKAKEYREKAQKVGQEKYWETRIRGMEDCVDIMIRELRGGATDEKR